MSLIIGAPDVPAGTRADKDKGIGLQGLSEVLESPDFKEQLSTSLKQAEESQLVPLKIPPKKHRRRRRVGKKVRGAIGFSELKPLVVEVVKGLDKTQFTVLDVRKALRKNKVKFDPGHVSLVLSRYLKGITAVDKKKKNGPPMNVYEMTGTVSLIKYTKRVSK